MLVTLWLKTNANYLASEEKMQIALIIMLNALLQHLQLASPRNWILCLIVFSMTTLSILGELERKKKEKEDEGERKAYACSMSKILHLGYENYPGAALDYIIHVSVTAYIDLKTHSSFISGPTDFT